MTNLKTNTNLEAFTQAYSDQLDTRYLVNRFNLSDEVENSADAFREMTQEQIMESIKDTFIVNYFGTFIYCASDVRRDVLTYIVEMAEDLEDAEGLLDDIVQHGCQSGIVNHLIYYKDTVAYFEKHEHDINDFVSEAYGLDMYGGSEFINDLAEMFPVDDFEDRMDNEDIMDKAIEIVADNNDITEDELNEFIEDYEEEIFEERYELSTSLEDQDKNYLAWAIFECEARQLQDELEEMDTEEEEEPLTVGEAIDMIEEEQSDDVLDNQDDSVQVLYDMQALGYTGVRMEEFGVSVGITDVRASTPVSTALNVVYGDITLFKSKRYLRETQQELNKNYYLVDGHTIVETDYMYIIIKDGQIIEQINK